MNLDMFRPRIETEDFLLSITKNCEMLVEQTHTKPQETLCFKLMKPRRTFSFNPSNILGFDFKWMIGFTSIEIYNIFLETTGENDKMELYTDLVDEFSFTEIIDEHEEFHGIPDTSPKLLLHDKKDHALAKF